MPPALRGVGLLPARSFLARWALLVTVFALFACSSGDSGVEQRLRISNRGEFGLRGLIVIFPEQQLQFGDLPARSTTPYRSVSEGVYGYAAYRYQLDGQTVTQPVIDWFGEVPAAGSAFTYVIDFDPARPRTQQIRLIEVRRDR